MTLRPRLLLFLLVTGVACRSHDQPSDDAKPSAATPAGNDLPPLAVKNDTPNLLVTWINEKGDFHVVQKPSDVPKIAKQCAS